MSSPFDAQLLGASVEFLYQPFSKPLQLSKGLIREITEARATVRLRVAGREAVGRGAIYLSDVWAWPDPSLTHDQRDAAMRRYCENVAEDLVDWTGGERGHPLELGLRLHKSFTRGPGADATALCGHDMPILARSVCASPFDAAIHDAAGRAIGRSAFRFYDDDVPLRTADAIFPDTGAAAAIRGILRPPVDRLDAWLIVGASDSMDRDVRPWVQDRGYHCFKLKILGKDTSADVARTVEVFHAVREMGLARPRFSVDSNEGNPDADSVLDYLNRLRSSDAEAFAALEYLEQPTLRDIARHAYDWADVGALKPVVLDEGLADLECLETAAHQHWSGLALKTCKGHSFALVAGAWAKRRGLLLTLQDLTNPGLAAIHSALFAAHVPTMNGVELNSPQFTPAANAQWLPRFAGLFDSHDGTHRLPDPEPIGLGTE